MHCSRMQKISDAFLSHFSPHDFFPLSFTPPTCVMHPWQFLRKFNGVDVYTSFFFFLGTRRCEWMRCFCIVCINIWIQSDFQWQCVARNGKLIQQWRRAQLIFKFLTYPYSFRLGWCVCVCLRKEVRLRTIINHFVPNTLNHGFTPEFIHA